MYLSQGSVAPLIHQKDIYEQEVRLESYRGQKVLISFFRFSTCPFCNLRLHALAKEYDSLNIEVIAIFESSSKNLRKHLGHHQLPFSVLSDKEGQWYKAYGLEKSLLGMMKGIVTRPLELVKGLFKAKLPVVIDGSVLRMPADFLVDEEGVIQEVLYAKDEGEHMELERIRRFSV